MVIYVSMDFIFYFYFRLIIERFKFFVIISSANMFLWFCPPEGKYLNEYFRNKIVS